MVVTIPRINTNGTLTAMTSDAGKLLNMMEAESCERVITHLFDIFC
ncbi:hypothetical protein JOC85_000634 [Bacillus mesophilus]|uniref:Uncharacterized protein n=1 Tax=Bacillus mesophilus TaxID=1808955 RepID=A0A6M0Q308_9BACI|nr:hypothetical protein [Bacillus mesophilus]MBM7659867.1 hypothetical protein [Bacillus mesophilus]NEY70726.1 hypothetical protein [Bacillus mesophilus]